jgi:hypothetical protein
MHFRLHLQQSREGLQYIIYNDGGELAFFILQVRLLSGFVMASATPKVIAFGYKNYECSGNKRLANCGTCGVKISDGPQTTSSFVRHLKTHPER